MIIKTSCLALVSLVWGIIGIIGIPILLILVMRGILPTFVKLEHIIILLSPIAFCLAIILGNIALIQIKRKAGILKGKGLALMGIVMGGSTPLILIAVVLIGTSVYPLFLAYSAAEDFDPMHYKGEMGNLVFPYKGKSLLYLYTNLKSKRPRLLRLSTTTGLMMAPVGISHCLSSYFAFAKDNYGTEWEAFCAPRIREITVESGSSQQLEIGPPFTASIDIKSKGADEVEFNLKMLDLGGNRAYISKSDSRSDAWFQIITPSGDIVWQDKFTFS